MPVKLSQINRKSNHSAAAEQCISKKNEDYTLHTELPQTGIARDMQSNFGIFRKGTPPGSGNGDNSSNTYRLFDYLQVQPKLISFRV